MKTRDLGFLGLGVWGLGFRGFEASASTLSMGQDAVRGFVGGSWWKARGSPLTWRGRGLGK